MEALQCLSYHAYGKARLCMHVKLAVLYGKYTKHTNIWKKKKQRCAKTTPTNIRKSIWWDLYVKNRQWEDKIYNFPHIQEFFVSTLLLMNVKSRVHSVQSRPVRCFTGTSNIWMLNSLSTSITKTHTTIHSSLVFGLKGQHHPLLPRSESHESSLVPLYSSSPHWINPHAL